MYKAISLAFIIGTFSILSNLFAQHTIVLQSGEKIECVVIGLENDVWTVYKDGKERKLDMKSVSSVFFKEYIPYDGKLTDDAQEKTIQADGFTVKYKVKGRTIVEKPRVSLGTEDKGVVVVKVTVDRYGNIRSAEPGAPGSTTTSSYLYAKAATAAKSAKFDENMTGPLITEGTITIIY